MPMSGTSAATPFVSGVAALILQNDPLAIPEVVKDVVIENMLMLLQSNETEDEDNDEKVQVVTLAFMFQERLLDFAQRVAGFFHLRSG